MADSLNTSYREILQNENTSLRCRELVIDTGSASGSTWESFHTKSGGGYAFKGSGAAGTACRNRFIYWKVNADTLELTEVSLDLTLTSNSVRFRFQDAALLGDISVHEFHGNVLVLVPTTCSVHRLVFPHPGRLQQKDQVLTAGSDRSQASIFSDTSVMRTQDPAHSHFLEAAGSAYNVHTADSWLTPEGNALFALALSSGVVQLIQLPPVGSVGEAAVLELKHSSVMQRLWTGLVPQLFRGSDGEGDVAQALLLHSLNGDAVLFTLGRDLKLRMWSCSAGECIMACDMMDFIPNSSAMKKTGPPAGSKFMLRKCTSSHGMHLGVFLSFPDKCQFCFFEPRLVGVRYQLHHISTLFGPQEELIDFCMCSDLVWTLWNTAQGETLARLAHVTRLTKGADRWSIVHSEPPIPLQVMVPDHLDPRQCHMDEIFTPGRFTTQAILKAINIFRKALDTTHLPESVVPLNALRSEVAAVVEYEIQRSASEYEMSHEEFMALQAQQWAKFYSRLVQYQHRGHQPLGLLVDSSTGMVAMVRKEALGFLRPCQTTEHMHLSPLSGSLANQIQILANLTEDGALCDDLAKLMGCLSMLRDSLSQYSIFCFEQDLFYQQDPVEIAHTVISEFLADPNQVDQLWEECLSRFRLIEDFVQSVEALIHLLDLAQSGGADSDENEPVRQLGAHRLFTSQQGVALICEAVSQMVRSRFDTAEDLLLTLTLLLHLGDQAGMSASSLERIKCDLMPRTATLVQAYHLLNWLCRAQATPVSAANRESSLRQQEILGISAKGYNVPLRHSAHSGDQHCTLLELFMHSYGSDLVREELQKASVFDDDPCAVWTEALVPTMLAVGQQIWPYSSFMLPEFLLIHCQYTALQEYVRLSQWSDLNVSSRRFLLGVSHLNTNEASKAYNCFVEATLGASQEEFLLEVARPGASSGDVVNARVLYYLKVLGLLEMFAEPLHVIELAKTAISIAEPDDPNLATLWSIIFKHELALGHNQAAYNTMLANPDSSRRKDCLREFLVVLCERSEIQTLVELPYRDRHVVLEDEVVSILEARARAIDLNHHNYYQLLYAFHVFRSNYRKAGSIMYEYGMRLGRECFGLKGLQRQAKAYLAALNALRLVEEKNAWIIKPIIDPQDQYDDAYKAQSSQSQNGVPLPVKRSIEVLELDAIQKEYILVHARLQLLQLDPDPSHMSGATASANETLSMLVNAGLMDSAVNICKMFDISMVPIFEGLAARCVQLAENSDSYMPSDNDYTSDAWTWLKQNNLPSSNAARDSSSTEHAWRMLHTYLSRYGSENCAYHRCVLVSILSQGFPLPDWLVASYKRVNSAELLRMYLEYDLLEEAAALVLEMLDSVCGKGKEYFGLKTFLHTGSPAVWLPYTAIDQLLLALRAVRTEPHYTELFHTLNERLEKYFGLVEDVSEQTIQGSLSSAGWNATNYY